MHYRVYVLGRLNRIDSPPQIVEADTDEAAVERARQLLGGLVGEIWNGDRRVARIEPGVSRRPHAACGDEPEAG